MYCPRLDHFVRFNPDGSIGRCGHMTSAPTFKSITKMEQSTWLQTLRQTFANNQWPSECVRCQDTEKISKTSIRLASHTFHAKQSKSDYLIVGGVLDNICNSACQTCNAQLSTKIGSLKDKNYIKIDNANAFWKLPLDRCVHLDLNGGEPSASKNYLKILQNLPANIRSVRINTNGSRLINEVSVLLQKGIEVTVTMSLDGIGRRHDYVRWPISWLDFETNLKTYAAMPGIILNTWTTVSALNIGDFKNILNYVDQHKLSHAWALLEQPSVLSVKHSNHLTRNADVPYELKALVACGEDNSVELQLFVAEQDHLRNIKMWDYLK